MAASTAAAALNGPMAWGCGWGDAISEGWHGHTLAKEEGGGGVGMLLFRLQL
jgi:hypothetical protein